MMNLQLKKDFLAVAGILLFISFQFMHPILALGVDWYEYLDSSVGWGRSNQHITFMSYKTEKKVGYASIKISYDGNSTDYEGGEVTYCTFNIKDTPYDDYRVFGFWMYFEEYPIGNPADYPTGVMIYLQDNTGRKHGGQFSAQTGASPYRRVYHYLSGASVGTWGDYPMNKWAWWEFAELYDVTPDESEFLMIWHTEDNDSYGHGLPNYESAQTYEKFVVELTGKEPFVAYIDYFRMADEQEFPPSPPPPPPVVPPDTYPLEDWIPIGMGLGGLGMIVFAPFILIWKRRKALHYVPYVFAMLILGIGCLIGWLWG